MQPADAARNWATTWQEAWEALDAEPIVALYARDACVSTAPFREPCRGPDEVRAYVLRVFGEEENPQAVFGAPIVDGNRAAVPWWATIRENGADTTLAGTSLLRFDTAGLVIEQWDTWNVVGEHRPAPATGGPFTGR